MGNSTLGSGSITNRRKYRLCFLNNVSVSNGICHITAKQGTLIARAVSWKPDNEILSDGLPNLRTYNYTSSNLWTKEKFFFGKYEALCRMPDGKGLWPAFWMYGGTRWNEIDIYDGYDGVSTIVTSIGHDYDGNGTSEGCNESFAGYDFSQWHTFTCIFDFDKITWLIDGVTVRVVNRFFTLSGFIINCGENIAQFSNIFFQKSFPLESMSIIISMGVGSGNGPAPLPDASTPFPSSFDIDYVRMWKYAPPLPPCDANDITVTSSPFNQYLSQTVLTAKNSITTSGTVNIGADKHWVAGNYIELNDGFETVLGVDFTAEIGDCDATNLRIITNNENNPIVLQSAVSAGKNPPSKEQQEETKTVSGKENNISPNPSSGIFTLIGNHEVQNIEVSDMLGNIVYKQKVNNNAINIDIDLSNQPKGIYILRVKNRDNIYTEKVAVQ